MPTSPPRRALSKVVTRVRSRGAREILALALGRAREFVSSDDRLIMFALDLSTPPPARPAPPGVTLRQADDRDARAYARDVGTDSAGTFRHRLSGDTRCYIVVTGVVIIHASWVTTERAWTREIRRYFTPPPGEADVYESFTR